MTVGDDESPSEGGVVVISPGSDEGAAAAGASLVGAVDFSADGWDGVEAGEVDDDVEVAVLVAEVVEELTEEGVDVDDADVTGEVVAEGWAGGGADDPPPVRASTWARSFSRISAPVVGAARRPAPAPSRKTTKRL